MATIDVIKQSVNIEPSVMKTVVRLSQNENGRELTFELTNVENIPGGSTVTIRGTKPDGVVYSAPGTLSGTTATFTEDTQLTAVAGTWLAKILVTNGANTVATAFVEFIVEKDPVAPGSIPSDSQLDGIIAQAQAYAEAAAEYALGAPLIALTASDMTDHDAVYLYEGSEPGYTAGDYYYWNGASWVSGGQYGAGSAITVDDLISSSSRNPVENRAIYSALKMRVPYPHSGGGTLYGNNNQVLASTGVADGTKWVNMPSEPPHASNTDWGTVKIAAGYDPGGGKVTFSYHNNGADRTFSVPVLSGSERLDRNQIPDATDQYKGAVILDRTVTTQDKAADAKAVRDLIGDLSDLDTTDKTNLVGAINEAAQSGGGGGGSTVYPYDSNPEDLGTASPGVSDDYARGDHVHKLPIAAQNNYGTIKMTFNGDAPGGYIRLTGNVGNNDTEMSLEAPRIESTGTIRNKYIPAATSADYGGVKVTESPSYVTLGYKDSGSATTQDLAKRAAVITGATIDSAGLITFTNFSGISRFTLQLPLYNGGVT